MTLDDVLQALKKAHNAGDEQAARKLADIATQMADPLKAAEAEIPVRYSPGEAAKKGFQRGLRQLGTGIFDTLPALGASALGFDEYAKKKAEDAARAQAEIAKKYPAQFQSYTEVDSPYEALQYAAETLGEVGPSALGVMLPGGIAGVGGRMLAARGAAGLAEQAAKKGLVGEAAKQFVEREIAGAGQRAMYGGVYMGSLAQNVPEVFQNIYEETGKLEPLVSGLAGGTMALLDSVVPGQVMSKLGAYGKLKAAEAIIKESGAAPSVWKTIGKEAALTAGKEGLTESAQEAISVAAEEVAGSVKGLLAPESIQRYKEAFVKGAIGGAAFGVVGGAGRGFAEKGEFQAKQERERVAQEEAERQKQLAGEVAASEAELKAITEASKQPQMELPGMGLGQEYGPYSALVPSPVEPEAEAVGKAPEQLEMFGPQGGVTKVAQKNVLRKITPTELENIRTQIGVAPTAKLFKPQESALMGLDLLNVEDAGEAKRILEAYAEGRSPKIQESVKKWVTTNLDPVITRGAPPDATGTDQQPSGAGTEVPSGGVAAPPAVSAQQPQLGGVVPSGSDVGKPVGGEGPQQGTLIPAPGEAPAQPPAPPAAPTAQPPAEPVVEPSAQPPTRPAPKRGPAVPQRPPEGASPVTLPRKENNDPSDEEATQVQTGLEGKSVIGAAKWLTQNSPDWDYRLIADKIGTTLKKLQDDGVKFNFNIANSGTPNIPPSLRREGTRGVAGIRGARDGITNVEVWLKGADFPGSVGVSYRTALHELIHAATFGSMVLGRRPGAKPEVSEATKRLDKVFRIAKREFNRRVREANAGRYTLSELDRRILTTNALQDAEEIVAWGFTDRQVQKWLEGVEYKKTGKSLWSVFVDSIRTFLGLPAKANTVLSEVLSASEVLFDNPISRILPLTETARDTANIDLVTELNEQSVRFPNLANKLVGPDGLADRVLQKTPLSIMTPARRTDIWRMLEKLALPARSLVYKALNASQMGEVASKYFGNDSIRFATILNEIGGYRQRIEEKLEPLNRQFVVHREKYPERHAALHALMNDATIADVAPYDDAETAKKYKNTTKEATYEALKKRFNNLNAEEKQLYKSAFTSFVALRNEFKKALKGNISELVKDEATALSIYDKIMNELSQVMIDHYFPLYRKGDFRLSYTLNGKAAVERFESQAERAAAQRALEAQGATDIEATSQLNQFNSDNIPDGTMLSAVMKIVKDAGGGKEDLDKVVQLVVSAFPETSILKRQQKRSGIPGYINDNAALVFDSVTSNNARQIATIKYREELKSLMNKMREKQGALRGDASEDAKTMFEDLDGRFRFAMDPDIAGWAQYASSAAFYWNLAANVSSALVQIATVPTVVFPNLGGRYGSTKAWKALNNARKLYQSSGFTRKVEGLDGRVTEEKSMLSIENLVNKGQAKEYAALINALKDTELLTTSTAQNAIRAENRTDSGYGAVNKLQRMTSLYGSFMMHHTERMSREITAVATYDLEMQRLKRDKPNMSEADRQAAAIQEAVRIVQRTHGAVTSTTGTRIGQTSVGKIFMVFKNYAFAQYYNLFSTIFRAFPVKNADPETLEDIKAARRQLVGMYGMVALFAGVKGVPLYWIAELAYDALRDEEDEDFDALMRRYLGEFLFKGPVNYITNLSIADRVGWTDLIWRENKNDRAGSSAIVQYLESSLAPLSVIKNFEKGANIISETGSWYRGIEAMLPAAFKNPMKALRYGSEGANTLRGDPVMADINVGNAAMQALGFAPADLMNQYEENATLLARQKAIRGNEQRLLKQYYVALKNGDTERAAEVVEKLYELGAKYPELGIGPALLNKSVRERDRFSSKLYHGMRLDDKLRDRLLGAAQITYGSGGGFDGGGASGSFE